MNAAFGKKKVHQWIKTEFDSLQREIIASGLIVMETTGQRQYSEMFNQTTVLLAPEEKKNKGRKQQIDLQN